MADCTLDDYELQLEHVEAAIIAEPDNEELMKLKLDLEEVIALTKELSGATKSVVEESGASVSHSVDVTSASPCETKSGDKGEEIQSDGKPVKDWRAGDRCLAVWSENGKYHEAVIEAVNNLEAVITFVGYDTTEINTLSQLRKVGDKEVLKNAGKSSKRTQFTRDRDRRKEKALKRVQKVKQLEEVKEQEKRSWLEFSKRATAKSMKGMKRLPTALPQVASTAAGNAAIRHMARSNPKYPIK